MNPSMEPGPAAVVERIDSPIRSPHSFSQPFFVFRNTSLNGQSAIEKINPLISCKAGPAATETEVVGFMKQEKGGVSNSA